MDKETEEQIKLLQKEIAIRREALGNATSTSQAKRCYAMVKAVEYQLKQIQATPEPTRAEKYIHESLSSGYIHLGFNASSTSVTIPMGFKTDLIDVLDKIIDTERVDRQIQDLEELAKRMREQPEARRGIISEWINSLPREEIQRAVTGYMSPLLTGDRKVAAFKYRLLYALKSHLHNNERK